MRQRGNLLACLAFAIAALALAGCGGGSPASKDLPGNDLPPTMDVEPADGADGTVPEDRLQDDTPTVRDTGPDGTAVDPGQDVPPPPPCVPGTACDDNDSCTFDDQCQDDETCVGTLAEACDDGIDCTQDVCTTAADCTHATLPGWCLVEGLCFAEGAVDPARPCRSCVTALVQDDLIPDDNVACDDGNPCTSGDHCRAGACLSAPLDCDDRNACTRDACSSGTCTHENVEGPCEDGNICTVQDACAAGVCQGQVLDCDDDNPCTADRCDGQFGCVHEFNTDPCDDGNICTSGDRCGLGICQSGADRLNCDDENACTDDGCVPTRPDGCVNIPNIAPCEDGDPCSLGDACRRGACQPGLDTLACDDLNPCTDDRCLRGVGCATVANTDPCDDGEPCFLNDVCKEGACAPGPTPLVCEDSNVCTDDSCEVGIGCINRPNADPCEDNNDCTMTDTCTAGVCIGQLLPGICDDGNDCTGDFCRPEGGCGHKGLPECRPGIVIDYPPRAATLNSYQTIAGADGLPIRDAAGRTKLGVRGHIEYPKPGLLVPFVTINGRDCAVSPIDNTFACRGDAGETLAGYAYTVNQGFNPIVVNAEDVGCQIPGQTCYSDHLVQSFYHSTTWYPVNEATPDKSMINNGLEMFLGPEVWDDNDTSTPDDIATILTLFVQNMDIGSLIQNPVTSGKFGWCSYRVNLNHIRFGQIAVDLVPTWGGLFFKATIPNFRVDIDVPISGFACPDFSGNASMSSITISATALLSMDANGNPQASVVNPDVVVSGLSVSLDGLWGFLLNWIIGFFEGTFTTMIETQFEAVLADQIGSAIAGAISGLALDQTFALPAFLPGTNPLSLHIVAKPSILDFTPAGGTIGMKATILTPRGTPHSPLGSIGRASCLGAPEGALVFPKHGPLEIGLHDDFFNLIPYALFWGGGLNLPLDPAALGANVDLSAYGISEMTLQIDFLLPPILSACNPQGKLMLQCGDVSVLVNMKLFGTPVTMLMYASLNSEAKVFIQVGASGGNELALAISEPVFIDIEIASLSGGLVGAEDTLGKLIRDTEIPMVLKALSGNTLASFPIPEIDLHAIAPQLPAGSKIAIDIRELLRITGNTVVSGQIK
jgi:hypothetical protein